MTNTVKGVPTILSTLNVIVADETDIVIIREAVQEIPGYSAVDAWRIQICKYFDKYSHPDRFIFLQGDDYFYYYHEYLVARAGDIWQHNEWSWRWQTICQCSHMPQKAKNRLAKEEADLIQEQENKVKNYFESLNISEWKQVNIRVESLRSRNTGSVQSKTVSSYSKQINRG